MPNSYTRTAMPGLDRTPSHRVRVASAEFTPVDKKELTPLVEAGSKRQFKQKCLI